MIGYSRKSLSTVALAVAALIATADGTLLRRFQHNTNGQLESLGRALQLHGDAKVCPDVSAKLLDILNQTPCAKDKIRHALNQEVKPAKTASKQRKLLAVGTKAAADPDGGSYLTADVIKARNMKHDKVVVSYYPSEFARKQVYMGWKGSDAIGRNIKDSDFDSKYVFYPSQMDDLAPKLTHIIYSSWGVNSSCEVFDPDREASWQAAPSSSSTVSIPAGACAGAMNDLMALKFRYPHLKLLLQIGGWNQSAHLSKCMKSSSDRQKIYDTFSNMMEKIDANWGRKESVWNGVDLMFASTAEKKPAAIPQERDGSEPENFAKLTELFRTNVKKANRKEAIITISAQFQWGNFADRLLRTKDIIDKVTTNADFVNVQFFGTANEGDPTTAHDAPFCAYCGQRNFGIAALATNIFRAYLNTVGADNMVMILPGSYPVWTSVPNSPFNGSGMRATESDFRKLSTFSSNSQVYKSTGRISFWDVTENYIPNHNFQRQTYLCPAGFGDGVVVQQTTMRNHEKGIFFAFYEGESAKHHGQYARSKKFKGVGIYTAQDDRYGGLMESVVEGFGAGVLPTYKPVASRKCYSRPSLAAPGGSYDFDLAPIGEDVPDTCQTTNRSLIFNPRDNSCEKLHAFAASVCGDRAVVILGGRKNKSGDESCVHLCSNSWTGLDDEDHEFDTVYYKCEGEK